MIKDFRDLHIWKLGIEIVFDVYRITKTYPKDETIGLVSQLRRASVSVPSNISEGFNRFHRKEYRQFLYHSLGSIGELETQFEISLRLGYINENIYKGLAEKLNHESRMMNNLINRL